MPTSQNIRASVKFHACKKLKSSSIEANDSRICKNISQLDKLLFKYVALRGSQETPFRFWVKARVAKFLYLPWSIRKVSHISPSNPFWRQHLGKPSLHGWGVSSESDLRLPLLKEKQEISPTCEDFTAAIVNLCESRTSYPAIFFYCHTLSLILGCGAPYLEKGGVTKLCD